MDLLLPFAQVHLIEFVLHEVQVECVCEYKLMDK